MKNKYFLIIILIIALIGFTGWWFFLRTNNKAETYTIRQWNNLAQTVEITIIDNSIIKAEKSKESDADLSVDTGGEYTLFTITGLKKGKTTAIVNVINNDGSIESSKKYYFEVNSNLSVKLQKMEDNYVIKAWHNFSQQINIEIADKTIISSTKSVESRNPEIEAGGENILFTITGLKKGNTTAIVSVINNDGTIESDKTYYFEVDEDLKVKLVDFQERSYSPVSSES